MNWSDIGLLVCVVLLIFVSIDFLKREIVDIMAHYWACKASYLDYEKMLKNKDFDTFMKGLMDGQLDRD